MSLWQAVGLGAGPSLAWLWLLWRRDDHEAEPWPLVALAALLGALATAGVLWTRPLLETWLVPCSPAVDAFLLTACNEEAWKLAALLPILACREVDEPLDGAIYGAAAGLGFASLENVLFARGGADAVLLLQRGFTATLLHAASSGCLGFCWAEGKLRRWGRGRVPWLAAGLPVGVLLHGTYDVFLLGEQPRLLVSLLVVLPGGLALLALKMRWGRARSHLFHPPPS
ncbi:MAG: PrsW family intramembrane metalloprotease [Planctomycetes bacterium]|nr:PrsW family intramembrane metalloprotease [Planctomycetota bacterium]